MRHNVSQHVILCLYDINYPRDKFDVSHFVFIYVRFENCKYTTTSRFSLTFRSFPLRS